jgi:nucleotide-binding universal stress UspA family protein
MYKRILAAIDGTDTSRNALDEALRLAVHLGSTVRVLYVLDSPPVLAGVDFYNPVDLQAAFQESGRLLLEQAQALMAERNVTGDTKMTVAMKLGEDVAATILRETEEWGGELVILGTHGRHGLSRMVVGSIAEQFVRISSIPVLLLRSP